MTPPVWLDAQAVAAPRSPLLDLRVRGRPDALPSGGPTPARLGARWPAANPRLPRLLHRLPTGAPGQRLVVAGAELGARADAESAPAVRAGCFVRGARCV